MYQHILWAFLNIRWATTSKSSRWPKWWSSSSDTFRFPRALPRHWTLWVRSRRNGFRGQLQPAKSSEILVVAGKVTKSKVAARICPVAALPTWRKGKSAQKHLFHSWIIWWMWKLPTILGLQLGVKSQKPWRRSPSTPVLYVERRSV